MRHDNLAFLDQVTRAEFEKMLDRHTREIIEPDRWTAFSWSVSRHQMFERCRREYYWSYYAARRVREANSRAVSAIWWLKQITSSQAWVGTVIHHIAHQAVEAHRDGRPLDERTLQAEAAEYYHAGIHASERGTRHDGQWVVLFEHIYPAEHVSIGRAEGLVSDRVRTFIESDAYGFVCSLPPEAIREIDEPFQSFDLTGVLPEDSLRVYAIPDVLLQDAGGLYIIDWKTGDIERQGIRDQAGVYRLYAAQRYGIPEEAIHVAIADLAGSGESVDPPGGVPTLQETQAFIARSAHTMLELLEDAPHNTASIEQFPMTDDHTLCRQCGFKRACWRHTD